MKRREVEVAITRYHHAQRAQHRIGRFYDALRDRVVEVGAARLEDEPREKQKADDVEDCVDDEDQRIIH